jgi:hypothetical protein
MVENRKAYRFPFRTQALLGDAKSVIAGQIQNLSLGGLYVTTLKPFAPGSALRVVFPLSHELQPLAMDAVVKRVVRPSANVEVLPGMAVEFAGASSNSALSQVQIHLDGMRRDFELASAILNSGEPEWNSIVPLLQKLQMPLVPDLGSLRYTIERVLRSIELIETAQSTEN